jgi:hypothetical protein
MPFRGLLSGLAGTAVMAGLFHNFEWAWRSEPPEAPKPDHPLFWAYGTAWGLGYGRGPLTNAPRFTAALWLTSLSIQTVLRIGEPPWRRPPRMLAADATTHLIYGVVVRAIAE